MVRAICSVSFVCICVHVCVCVSCRLQTAVRVFMRVSVCSCIAPVWIYRPGYFRYEIWYISQLFLAQFCHCSLLRCTSACAHFRLLPAFPLILPCVRAFVCVVGNTICDASALELFTALISNRYLKSINMNGTPRNIRPIFGYTCTNSLDTDAFTYGCVCP